MRQAFELTTMAILGLFTAWICLNVATGCTSWDPKKSEGFCVDARGEVIQ